MYIFNMSFIRGREGRKKEKGEIGSKKGRGKGEK